MMMDMWDGVFLELNAREVAKATGLPPGGRKVDIRAGQCLADREVLLAKVHAILGTDMPRSNNIPFYKVKKIVQSASKDAIQGDERTAMKAAVTLLASSTFLVPRGATTKIANELLPVVAEPDNIVEFDFCDYVVEGLRVAARKLREDLSMDAANVKLEGCLIVPQIMWLDYHEHGLHGRETLQLPRIGHYSDTKLKDLIKKHATAQGIECGLELGDVPRSPAISVRGSCSQAARAQAVAAQMVGHASGSHSAAGPVDMDNLPLRPTKVVEAFKATMEFHYKRCVPRHTRQQTMHELLPPAPNIEAAAPNAYHEPMIDTSFLYLMTEAVIPAEEYFAQEEEYDFSPFELELPHADLYPDHVCQNFYEDFIYLSCAKSLSSTWYKSSSPTILVMDGHKLKYQFSLGGAMFHNGMEAWVRGFNEREKKMFDRVGLRFQGLLSRMYFCSLLFSNGESPGYIAYYAHNFNGTRLEEDIPRAGLASRRKRMLYETLAAQCNTAPRAGFMVQVAEEI
ncbi:hypothetical protein ZWY2020_050074 [Hordeum vulgare]|nr:hypothetical protein ZWY2020_050074 [Hordeum vulgare]